LLLAEHRVGLFADRSYVCRIEYGPTLLPSS
jgi:hypothetical protein